MASTPGHHNDVVLVGTVVRFYHGPNGYITGLVLQVQIDEPALIPVLLTGTVAGFRRGDTLWVRGALRSDKLPGQRAPLLYVAPRHVAVLKRGGLQASVPLP